MNPAIIASIDEERARQEAKWGGQHDWGEGSCASSNVPDIVKATVLAEECGEVARAVLDGVSSADLKNELVQVAAVCTAWLEALEMLDADSTRGT